MQTFRQKYRLTALLAAASMLAGIISGTGTAAAAEPEIKKKTVKIPCGINSLLYLDENGEAAGYCSEYLDKLAQINNWQYEYIDTSWSQALEMLDTGEIDILFPVSLTPERTETMDMSSIIGGYTASGLFVMEKSEYTYGDYESFNGAKIAVTENSSNASALEEFAREHHFTYEPVYIETTSDKTEALKNGSVDMIMFSAANEIVDTKLVSVLNAEPFYYAVKKGNAALLSELNSGMQEILMHNSDLMAQLFSSSMVGPNSENQIAFTKEEQTLVDNQTNITVGFYLNTEPLAYIDSSGEYKGIYIELMERVRDATQLNIELYPISRGSYWQDLLKDGTIDFYIGASDGVDLSDDGFMTTSSFMDYETVLVTRNDYNLHKDNQLTIALTNARSYWENGLLTYFPNARILYCKTAKDCLLAVKDGSADAAMLNTVEYNYQSKNARFSDLMQWTNYRSKYGTIIAAYKDIDEITYSAMDKALGTLSSSVVSDVINTNLNMPYQSSTMSDYIYSARYFIILAIIIVAVIAAASIFIYQIRRRQREIEQEAHEHEKKQLRIMAALSLDYVSIYYVNLDTDTYTIVEITNRLRDEVATVARQSQVFSSTIEQYNDMFVLPEYQDDIRKLVKSEALIERFKEEKDFAVRYQVKPNDHNQEFFEMHFVDVSERPDEHIMVMGFRCVDNIAKDEIAQKKALKEAFDAANSANHAKSDFLSKMSHDIRTPMNAIIGMTAIAAAHIDDKERVQDSLAKITTSSRHLLGLINEVLDMSKIESGKIELTEEEFNLSELLNNLLQMIQPQISQNGHNLEVHIMNIEHEDVIGDSLRIQQAFTNIMGNAIKYTPKGGNIRLTVREKAYREQLYGCYEFIFEDDGIGMSQEFVERIFEPFSRAEDARVSKIQGTGLGMAITKNIVQMMNGDIQIDSKVGKGSKFTVTIFLKLQNKEDDLHTEELEGLPVLVADDDQIACEAACQMLEEIGMDCEWVLSGIEAVKRVEETHAADNDFYAIILDWKMPEMDGLETAKAIRKIVGPDIPLIILSAYDWSDIEAEAREAGVDAFLSKPVFKSGLVRLFKKLKTGESDKEDVKQALEGVMKSDYSGYRSLLVEDNDLNREIATEILQMTGMNIETAENGQIAVDMFQDSPRGYYDIIFMDVQMPVMNGYDATIAIRALDRPDAASIPIVAMTANAFAEDVQNAKNAGMNEHLAKPLDFDKLTDVMKKYLS